MIERFCKRNWLSPLVGVFFVAVGVSGTLMLFHIQSSSLRVMHEWIGLAFVVAATLHLLLNWRPLMTHCKTRQALIALTVGAVLCTGFLFAGAAHEGHGGNGPHGPRGLQGRH